MVRARAILAHGGSFLAPGSLKLATIWLSRASDTDRQCFRNTFGKMQPFSLFAGKTDYTKSFAACNLRNTAEHIYRASVSKMKQRIHEVKLANMRGLVPPPSSVPSGLPAADTDTGVGSAAMASSCAASDNPAQYRPKQISNTTVPRGTTYEAFFSAQPPAGLAFNRPPQETQGGTRRTPWGDVDSGFVKGTLQSHTAFSYPPQDPSRFKNYNENYAVLLAAQYSRDKKRAKEEAVPSAAVPADEIVEPQPTAGGGGGAVYTRGNGHRIARPMSACGRAKTTVAPDYASLISGKSYGSGGGGGGRASSTCSLYKRKTTARPSTASAIRPSRPGSAFL